jgi:hypothetical protein
MTPLLERVDHLVFATPDLDSTVADLERRLGVRPSPGGRHLDRGTRNALLALGPRCYLEIVGPDPEQSAPPTPRWFGIDGLSSPRLVAWAANTTDLERIAAEGARSGVGFGPITSGHRQRPDGVTLRWRFTDPTTLLDDGLIPFFIDWGSSPHPTSSAPAGAELIALDAEHPDPDRVRGNLQALGFDLNVAHGPRPALIATIRTATSTVEIR